VQPLTYEQWLSALCIWREARGESAEAWNAIWFVINNRTQDAQRRWPRTIAGVVAQHMQFSSMTAPGNSQLVLWPVEPTPLQGAGADWKAFEAICDTVVTVPPIGTDPTKGANMYESFAIGEKLPSWATAEAFTVQIGAIRFYKI
jgi:spore germination cell wall hydrolase CwlJ-like protein